MTVRQFVSRPPIGFAAGVIVAVSLAVMLAGCTPLSTTPPATDGDAAATETEIPVTAAAIEDASTGAAGSTAGDPATTGDGHPAGWTDDTHSNDVDPNYAVVFAQDKVNEITITIAPDVWEAMQANMVELLGEPGTRDPGAGAPGEMMPPPGGAPPTGFQPPAPGERPAGMAPPAGMPDGGPGDFTVENPIWVEATIEFDGNVWTHVGVRYKGNSSLMSGWNSGSLKLPFKFDFDEFEDDYPEIDNQRFYGFKQLSLANGFSDPTFLRDALTYELLDEAGLVAAETAFYKVILDYGEGPVDLGIYTVIEVIDDTVVERYFGSDDGNIYEGDGRGVSLAKGTADQIESSFQKENNEDEADWSDIEALYAALHDEARLSDPAAWRAGLESLFDVDAFLEWLALSAVIGHWDTYGAMSHNFYLYDDPATGRLTWISWDHNMTMGGDMGARPDAAAAPPNEAAQPARRGGPGRSVSLDKADVGEDWPLIRFLLDDPVYHAAYVGYVEEAGAELFTPEKMEARVRDLADLLAPFAEAEIGEEQYAQAVQQLIDFAQTRAGTVAEFLAQQAQQ